jgi:hypothetical protein
MMASGEIRISTTTMRQMPVLAESGCYSLCLGGDPASFSIIGNTNFGANSEFSYQLEDALGNPLIAPGYSLQEHLVPDIGINTNGKFIPLTNGVAFDTVGFDVGDVPKNAFIVSTQTFTIQYRGLYYELTSVFQHLNIAVNGFPINIVYPIYP